MSFLLLVLMIAVTTNASPQVRVRSHTELNTVQNIVLGDVADFVDLNKSIVDVLSKYILFSKPIQIGEKVEFSGETISTLMRSHSSWLQLKEKPQILIPHQVIIENVGFKMTAIKVKNKIQEHWQALCQCRVQVEDLVLPFIPTWKALSRWDLQMGSEIIRGSFTLPVVIYNSENQEQKLWIRGRMSLFQKVPVTKRSLNYGERIETSDIRMEEREITFSRDSCPEEKSLIGKKVKRPLALNEIVFNSALEKEKALNKGQEVKIFIQEQGWEVGLQGVAEQDAYIGDTIKVLNSKSKQSILVRVIGRGEVQIQ
ncbi:MAG: flagellar basal body P-ring formation chaperone FlgA [Bdellovibrionales bacterium]|nr:flagellar basal body P-ring formation chaperone FlgA [Bdellovibrionales bacterium]